MGLKVFLMKVKHKCLAKKEYSKIDRIKVVTLKKNWLYILLVIGRALAYAVELKLLTID